MKLIIYDTLPGLNQLIQAERSHRIAGAKFKAYAQEIVAQHILTQKLQPVHGKRVMVTFTWYERDKRRDYDNISAFGRKVILDALVQMGVLRGDGWRNIAGFGQEMFYVDKVNPRIEVEITGVDE